MASRAKRQTSVHDKIWNFNVCDPTLHPNGFTIYKVISRVFRMSAPDSLTEITTWKRYNDFKELYKGMNNLHRALHRRDSFPHFAKPKLFGRFDEAVIEERRQSAMDLLVFIGGHSHLYNSKIFEEFLKGGRIKEGASGKVLKPSKLDINRSINPENKPYKEQIQPVKHPPDDNETMTKQDKGEDDSLDGVWNFPQVPENISLNSFDDTDEAIDDESVLSNSLPEMDMSLFDPLKSDELGPPTPGMKTSSSWLFEAMDTCAGIENNEIPISVDTTEDTNQAPNISLDNSTRTDNHPDLSDGPDLSDFDPLKSRSLSKVEIGKGDLDLSWSSRASSTSSRTSSVTSSPRHVSKGSPSHRFRSSTNDSVSTMDLGGKEDYIYLAADQICLAQECEASSKFELAFSYYKSGVGILLQGVQSDKNKARRDAVRRKTAQYLMKAEDLYNRHLANDTVDDKRWSTTDNMLSPSGDLDPSLTLIKAPVSEMKNYKVLGAIDRVILVMDKTSDETFVIKTIHKSSICSKFCKTIMPVSCPYMVNLHKFYETENAVFLVLQHATGGKLWNYIGEYLQYNKTNSVIDSDNVPSQSTNVYSGFNVYTNKTNDRTESDKILENLSKDRTESEEILDNLSSQNNFEDNKLPDTVSDISDASDDKIGSDLSDKPDYSRNVSDTSDDKMGSDLSDKPDFSRNVSLSSEENNEENDVSLSDQREDVFQDLLLNSNRTNLENFSINSIDSNEGRPRIDSYISENIESIPEEQSPTYPSTPTRNCQSNGIHIPESSRNKLSDSDYNNSISNQIIENGDQDADVIVKNAKDLLRSVERTLSQTDSEVNECIYPDTVENKNVVSMKSENLNDSCDTLIDHDEPSIYDVNRSLSDSDNESKHLTTNNLHDNDKNSTTNHSQDTDKSIVVQYSSSETLSEKSGSQKSSRSSTLTDQKRTKPPKLSRMNSKELSRSFEIELKSPQVIRQRTLSDIFKQMDIAMSSPDQVKIPETCIRQWIAEIIIAVSRLHAEGLICRDLRPDNILLGDNGHILLSYFCQISLTDHMISTYAEDQIYVAPEVNGIGTYTEVCDWWSVGSLLYELVVCRSLRSCHPGGVTPHTQLYLPSNVSPEVQSLLHQLLCYNPKERLGSGINKSEDIKAHPFFSGIDWNQLEKLT